MRTFVNNNIVTNTKITNLFRNWGNGMMYLYYTKKLRKVTSLNCAKLH